MKEFKLDINPELKTKWIEALRSGKYKQGNSFLVRSTSTGDTYCCLGVLGIICRIPKDNMVDKALVGKVEVDTYDYPESLAVFGDNWKVFAFKNDGRVSEKFNPIGEKLNFNQIADLIEKS